MGCEEEIIPNNPCEQQLTCYLVCVDGYVLDENGCETCECIDYREKYIGLWQFIKYWGVTHPLEPNSGDTIWIGNINYGNQEDKIIIPYAPSVNSNDIFSVNVNGVLSEPDSNPYNYFFEGYFYANSDSLYYTGTGGSPFSTTSITIYGNKIN